MIFDGIGVLNSGVVTAMVSQTPRVASLVPADDEKASH
jgi:hypothetical protein